MPTPTPAAARAAQHALTLCLLVAPALGQNPSPGSGLGAHDPVDLGAALAPWLGRGESGIEAHAMDYKASFGLDGMVFTPALGAVAPSDQPLGLKALDAHRGGDPMLMPAADPSMVDGGVHYDRGGIVERFEVRKDGIEHSYVFEALPSGEGDLVIRHRLDTPLVPDSPGGERGLSFLLEGRDGVAIGGVRVSGVFGIDAMGRRFAGTVEFQEGVLTYRLPATDVATAALPLTVDPFLSTLSLVPGSTDDSTPQVAYSAASDVWAVCWSRVTSSNGRDILAGLFNPAGGPVSSLLPVATTSRSESGPRVAYVAQTDDFLVAWTEVVTFPLSDTDVVCRQLKPSGVLAFTPAIVAGGSGVQNLADMAGDPSGVDNEALILFEDKTSGGDFWMRQVQMNSSSVSPFSARANITNGQSSWNDSNATISGPGNNNTYMVVWSRRGFVGTSNRAVHAAVVDRNLGFRQPGFQVLPPDKNRQLPNVDGDGEVFLVAYELPETSSTLTDYDIGLTSMRWDAGSGSVDILVQDQVEPSGTFEDQRDPEVGFVGGQMLVVHTTRVSQFSSEVQLRYLAVDPLTCLPCEAANGVVAADPAFEQWLPGVGTQSNALDDGEGALVVWRREAAGSGTSPGDVMGRIFSPRDGVLNNLGGGCGSAGALRAGCAKSPNPDARVSLIGATPATTAWLVISKDQKVTPCGTCVLRADPFGGFLTSVTVGGDGIAEVSFDIPGTLFGEEFFAQWVVMDPNPACPPLLANLTDALRIELQ